MPLIEYFKSENQQISIVCGRGVSKKFPMHRHLSLSLGMVLKGERFLYIGNQKYIIAEGDIFIINSGEPHAIGPSHDEGHDYMVISVSQELLHNHFLSEIRFHTIIESSELAQYLNAVFKSLIAKEPLEKPFDIPFLLHILQKNIKETATTKDDQRLEKARELLDSSFHENVLLQKIADRSYMSAFHFSRLFKKHTGLAPHQYLLDNRLRNAREMLEKQEKISDIAIACGFYDTSHFIRHFSNYYGVSPYEFQKGINKLPL